MYLALELLDGWDLKDLVYREGVDDPMDAKETFELVRAYYAIANGPRRELLGLIQALHAANEQSAAQPESVAVALQE